MFRLALKLGYTVEELENKMSFAELQEWIWFYQLEPFGADWLQSSTIAATVANCHLEKGKTIDNDFFLPVKKEKKQQSLSEFKHALYTVAKPKKNKDSKTK